MKRVLVFGMTENPGGVETVILNYYRNIDHKCVQFDFLCNSFDKVAFEDELLSMGGRTYHFTSRRKSPIRFRKELNAFFKEHAAEYSAIWVNVSSLANIDYLKFAKHYGIKHRIIHSHNSRNMDGLIRGTLHTINKTVIHKYATDFWACSIGAAVWFYPSSLISKAVVIHNAIDIERVSYDPIGRFDVRNEFGIADDCYLIGNIGRLHFQKNQFFAIDVFNDYLSFDNNAKLVFVGQGEDEQELKTKASRLGIEDKVIFTGVRRDIQSLLSAFDVYLFPSVFEGLGVAALEAEANGLPVLASADVIPEEVQINDNFSFYSLDYSAKQWAKKLFEIKNQQQYNRKPYNEVLVGFKKSGFDIKEEAKKLQNWFMGI